ncbi:thiamine pyrophosphokinase [Acaromyces ingoldii]|uniref:Thiamine pyrophosphokinase n=1 Tax=Acaromyces ingoldii TaxID=215250 RepID=A0A316YGJ9_9BASI|nr:thiamine pyrophosphokinase [Acaromyces ingoldii]PWN88547.1 thiamine pyrophosphokinase [Acaromyces ingoldii]
MAEQHWDPSRLFEGATGRGYAVILLNQPILPVHRSSFLKLWCGATLRICADGGANRLYDSYFAPDSSSTSSVVSDVPEPHDIIGDLDSLRLDVRSYFEQKGKTTVRHVASQYSTDLQKCVLRVEELETEGAQAEQMDLVLVGGLSGRLDQTMHTIHVLCQLSPLESSGERADTGPPRRHKKMPRAADGEVREGESEEDDFATLQKRKTTYVISENSVAWILSKGNHSIDVDDDRLFGPTCGLLPFELQLDSSNSAAPTSGAIIKTQGLEWDLDGTPSAVGGFLSTSNHLRKGQQIHVQTDRAIIWTVELRSDQS